MSVPLLSSFYFGSVEHFRLLATHPKVIIDIGEHFERQSYRTRTGIVGTNGPQDLMVQVARRSGEKMPMRTVGLSYRETWPQQHVHAIRSAYGNAPWFIHYFDGIGSTILRKYERLVDLDLATLKLAMGWLGLTTEVVVTEDHQAPGHAGMTEGPDGGIIDLRTSFHPKKPLPPDVSPVPYYPQVFGYRHGFIPRRSIIDLVCNRGPQSLADLLSD